MPLNRQDIQITVKYASKRLRQELACYSYQCPAILRAKISELNYIGTELCL